MFMHLEDAINNKEKLKKKQQNNTPHAQILYEHRVIAFQLVRLIIRKLYELFCSMCLRQQLFIQLYIHTNVMKNF